jgi:hypothetical protein
MKLGRTHIKFNEASVFVSGRESWALNLEGELEH